MNETQTKEYLKNLSFGIKDKNKTEQKYKDYKTEKYKSIIRENKAIIEEHFLSLYDDIKTELLLNPFRMDYLKLDQKTDIRHFKTLINSVTFELNKRFIGELDNLNNNEARSFNIRFYIDNYKQINSIMKEVLSVFVREYPKKAIVKKLTN